MQILRLMLVLLLVLTMVCSISALDNRRLRHRRSPTAESINTTTNNQVVINSPAVESINSTTNNQVVINSEAFLLDFGPGIIPDDAYLLQAFQDVFASLYDSTGIQDASIVDKFVSAELHHFVIVCVTVMNQDSLATLLYNRLLRRRRKNDGLAEVVNKVSSGEDSNTDPMCLMNQRISQAGYQVHLMVQVPESICAAADMINVPQPSVLSPTTFAPSRTLSLAPSAAPSTSQPSLLPYIEQSTSPSASPTIVASNKPTRERSESPSAPLRNSSLPLSKNSLPTLSPSQTTSSHPSSMPSLSLLPSSQPTTSPMPSLTPYPSLSMPSLMPSVMPSVGSPDWQQYGSTIMGRNKRTISLSNDGHILAAVFYESIDSTPVARAYKYTAEDWQKTGSDIFATHANFVVDSVALSGDGTTIAVAMTSTATGGVSRQFSVQVYSLSDFQPVGELIVESLPYSAKFMTQLSLSNDAGLLSFGMTTEAGEGTFLLQTYQRIIANSWQRFGAALTMDTFAGVEISGDGHTVALLHTNPSRIFHLNSAGDWEDRLEGLPLDYYFSMALNEDGLHLATRQLSLESMVDIFAFENGSWNHSGTVQASDVHNADVKESRFGYHLDLSADGKTVAIATFRSNPTFVCVQAFHHHEDDHWLPKGRPPCFPNVWNHTALGSYLALSGDGLLMAAGDIGNYWESDDNGHIHTYAFVPVNEALA